MLKKFSETMVSLIGYVTIVVALWAALALIVVGIRSVAVDSSNYFRTADYLAANGLDVSKPVPLELGSSVTGPSGNFSVNAHAFLLSSNTSISGRIQPGSAVRLGLSMGTNSYILEVPYENVVFQKVSAKQSSAIFSIRDHDVPEDNADGGTTKDYDQHSFLSWMRFRGSDLKTEQPDLLKSDTWRKIEASQGLGSFLKENLLKVTLMVTSKEYSQYLGSPGS